MSGIYLGLTYGQKVFFAIWTILIYLIGYIVAKIKNKASKISSNETIYPKDTKKDYDVPKINIEQQFIGEKKYWMNEIKK